AAVSPRRDERAQASSARALIGQIGAIAHGLASEAGIGWDRVHHVTVGSPGVFEPTRGAVTLAPNRPGGGRRGRGGGAAEQVGGRHRGGERGQPGRRGGALAGLWPGGANFGFLSVGTGV